MKKSILLLGALLFGFNAFAQLPVSTTAQDKKVLLEEFTGIYCGYCPAGHVIANGLKGQHGSDFWVINVHVGGFANPNPGDPDFRTSFGTAIANQSGLCGYPAGTVNRHEFSGLQQTGTNCTATTGMSRGDWGTATTQTLGESSPVNIALEATLNEQTRELMVVTEYYYTAAGNGTSNKLNVALLQNNVEGPQSGGSASNAGNIQPSGNYLHQHMLRHMLTGQWGQDITNITSGATAMDTFYYTIPASLSGIDYDLGNLEIVAFISDGQEEVMTAGGTDIIVTNHANALDLATLDVQEISTKCPGNASEGVWVKVKNMGATTLTSATLSYSVNGGSASTENWTGSLEYGQFEYVNLPAITFSVTATNSFDIEITNINGSADAVTSNNIISSAFNSASETTTSDITIKITLDNYGSETSWTLKDGSGATVATSPAYANNNPGAVADVDLTLPNDCYSFEIEDSYGDGMCCAYGNGGYEIWSNGALIAGTSGGQFAASDSRKLTINATSTNVEEVIENTFKLFPNPASTELNISFVNTIESAVVNVIDVQGRTIISQVINNADFHKVNVADLSNGIYMVVINADGKTTTEKISVLK
jgi:hypothetical protein